ncbi:hypothetical protein T440DRAFT_497606 [Plenodomus tracheiphilus IPT5]|uniref:Transcription factor Iwr1 domain-containing protein n=1 Tax=Plenodomus tracheiphilus IPT5 TaxID=1408161 RepID=A0A6A7BDP4_9PLEO|nr:hypothetical protein T440DRAFT_497606 [Plenodomus tracheiphilus IPT5]
MSLLPPQTISLKRRRNEAPVDALRFDETDSSKRRKNNYAYRRLTKPNDTPAQSQLPPTPTTERRFQLEAASVSGAKRIFIEARQPPSQTTPTTRNDDIKNGSIQTESSAPDQTPDPTSTLRPRKRPGAASALTHSSKPSLHNPIRTEPSQDDLRKLEALSQEVSHTDNLHIPLPTPSPSKYRPRAPAQRFAARHPEKAAALSASEDHNGVSNINSTGDSEMMDIDTDDFIIETYIREPLLPNAPLPTGTTIGLLVLHEGDDDDWWNGEDSGSEGFDTDDEDENAEDYYANDYPEDELSEDDELGRDVYQKGYRHGSDEEEWGATIDEDDDAALASGEDEDDLHYKMTVPKAKRVAVGYWGTAGETL